MLSSVLSDQELVKNYLNGDNSSFEILLTRHKSRVFAFIMSKVKNRDLSEDIFQDTFIKVINSLQKGKYNEEGKFLPWMMRISHNLVIDHFRKEAKIRTVRPTAEFDIFDVFLREDWHGYLHEDNQAMIRVVETGKNPTMKTLKRCHGVDLRFLHT